MRTDLNLDERAPRLMPFFLNGLYAAAGAAASPFLLARFLTSERWQGGLLDRFGFQAPLPRTNRPRVWIHAASVGEVQAAAPFIQALRERRPSWEVVATTVTTEGQRVALDRFKEMECRFFPLDFTFVARRALSALRPDLFIAVEMEFWPNFLYVLRRLGVPAALVNGRITDRTRRRMTAIVNSWIKPFSRFVVEGWLTFEAVAAQTEAHADAFREVGVPGDRIGVTGNLKYDSFPAEDPARGRDEARAALGLEKRHRLIIAGSTHAGEEVVILQAFLTLVDSHPDLVLLLAPRHRERLGDVERLVRESREIPTARTSLGPGRPLPKDSRVILLDTWGELGRLYAGAGVVFMGGSLVPVGGHNILEPAAWGRPVIIGPHMENFQQEARLLLEAGAAVQVAGEERVLAALSGWAGFPQSFEDRGRKAREILVGHLGASQRTLDHLAPLLDRIEARYSERGKGGGG